MQIVLLLIFVAVTGLAAAIFMMLAPGKGNLHDRRVRRTVARSVAKEVENDQPTILLRKDIVEKSSRFRKQLTEFSNATQLAKLFQQSGTQIDQGSFIMVSAGFGCAFAVIAWLISGTILFAPVGFAPGAMIPYLYLLWKRKRRIKTITEQFPDALEMLVSALRAGQAFATALGTVAAEMSDPLSAEFQTTFDEQNFGVALLDALEHLRDRIDTVDMEFFVTAVSIQRETGGNLAEILSGLGTTIRQRLKLFGHIRALTAQGRYSGMIVAAMPVALGGILYLLNPDYVGQLLTSTTGNYMLGAAFFMQVCGFLIIRKIVNFKV